MFPLALLPPLPLQILPALHTVTSRLHGLKALSTWLLDLENLHLISYLCRDAIRFSNPGGQVIWWA